MNPMVDLHAYNEDISSKPETFFENFDVVCLLDQRKDIQVKYLLTLITLIELKSFY